MKVSCVVVVLALSLSVIPVSSVLGTVVYSEPFTNANADGWINTVATPWATTGGLGDGFYIWTNYDGTHGNAYYLYSVTGSSGYMAAADGKISASTPLIVSATGNRLTISMEILDYYGHHEVRDVTVTGKYADSSDASFSFTYSTSGAARTWQTVSQSFSLPQNLISITGVSIGAQLNAWDYIFTDNIKIDITTVYPTLSGQVILNDFTGSKSGLSVTAHLRGTNSNSTSNVMLSADGTFSIPNVAPDTYDVWIKPGHWLANTTRGVVVSGTGTISIGTNSYANGDCDGDNAVTANDLSTVLAAMDSTSGGTADLNGDGAITSTDLSVVLANMDSTGEQDVASSLPLLAPTGVINVCDNATFGNSGPCAKGDGVTDDTVAINMAFDYARFNPGSEVFFPFGKYLISDTLYLTCAGFTIRMEGQFSDNWTRQLTDSGIYWSTTGPTDRPMMKIYNSADYSVEGLCLDGGNRAQDGLVTDNISGGSLTDQSFTNCIFKSCTRYGFCISPWQPGHPAGGIQNDLIRVANCKFTNCGSSGPAEGSGLTIQSAQSICDTFDNCTFVSRQTSGGKYHVWIRAGRSISLRNCTWQTYQNPDITSDVILDPLSCSGASIYGGTSTAVGSSGRYFYYCNYPNYGMIFSLTMKNVHAEAPVYLNIFGHQGSTPVGYVNQTGVVVANNPYLGNLTVIDTYYNEHTARGVCHDNTLYGTLQADPTVVHWNP